MPHNIIRVIKRLTYFFLLLALVASSLYLPISKVNADNESGGGPGTISIYSISPSVIKAGESVTITGFPIGGDTLDNDCPFPPVTNHQYYAYPLTTPRYTLDGGPNKTYTLTQTQAGNSHATCTVSPHEADQPYLYSFIITIPGSDTQNLALGEHTVTVKATDQTYGVLSEDVRFTVVKDPILPGDDDFNFVCSPDQRTIAPGYTASYTATATRVGNFIGTVQNFEVTGYPSGSTVSYNPSTPTIVLNSSNTSGSVQVSIDTPANVTPGQYLLVIASDYGVGTLVHHCSVYLNIEDDAPPGDDDGDNPDIKANGSDGPLTVDEGTPVNLTWDCKDASTLSYKVVGSGASSLVINGSGKIGSRNNVDIGYGSSFTLYCYNQAGQQGTLLGTDSVDVGITFNPFTQFPTAKIQVFNTTTHTWMPVIGNYTYNVTSGNHAAIRWKATYVSSCLVSSSPADGSAGLPSTLLTSPNWATTGVDTGAITQTHVYTISCTADDGEGNITTVGNSVTIATVATPDFTFVCNSLSKTIPAGQSTFFDTTATALNGFNSQVTVSLNTPLPAGVTSTPVTITPTAVASVPVSTLVTSPQGTHNLTFTATGGGKTHTCTSQLNLTAPEGAPELLSLVLTPETANINVGDTQTYTSIAWYTDGTSVNVSTNAATVYTSSGKVATMSSNIATGELEGTVTINAVYTASGDSASDSATLIVGAGASLSATLTCPSGQHTCEIPYGTAINLSWTSTGATSCYAGNGPDLVPPISGTSGTSSTGNLTSNQTYTLGCDDGVDKATDQVTVTVNSAAPSFSTSDKDITAINSVNLSPAPSGCSGGTDSVGAVTFKEGDQVSFKINLCNTGSATASGITVVDQLTNLAKPAAGWTAKYNGSNITPVESGTAPNKTLTFTIPGTIAVGERAKTLTFNAIVTKPSGLSNTIYRFQNLARINADNTNWTIGTPLYIFYAGSRIPSKQEVAP